MNRLVNQLRAQGQLDEALALGTELKESALGADDLDNNRLGQFLINHGRTLSTMRRYAETEQAFEEARTKLNRQNVAERQNLRDLAGSFVKLFEAWNEDQPDPTLRTKLAHWRTELTALDQVDQ